MKKSIKVLAASVAFALSGAANAAMVTGAGGTNGELFVTVWDQAGGQSYHLDLGVTAADVMSNPTTAMSYDLSADANFAAFMGNTSLLYMVTASNSNFSVPNQWGYLATTDMGIDAVNSANASGYFALNNAMGGISNYAIQLNAIDPGTAADTAGNYSAVAYEGMTAYAGDANWGVNLGGLTSLNVTQSVDNSVAFYSVNLPLGNLAVTELGSWTLTSDGSLTYGVSSVPVPAAVWLFGSGLVGLLSVARRRKA